MSVMLPSELVWVLNLLGFTWPQADEDRLMEAAQHWRDFASEVGHVRDAAARHATTVSAENTGAAIDAFSQYWEGIGGSGGHLDQARQAAEMVADVLEGFAAVVMAVKADVVIQLGILAGEIAVDTAGAFFTFGATELAAAGEVVATRVVMREILDRIVHHIEEKVAQTLEGDVLQMFKRMLAKALRKDTKGVLKEEDSAEREVLAGGDYKGGSTSGEPEPSPGGPGTGAPREPLPPADVAAGKGTASQLERWARSQGWTRTQSPNGPIKYLDENGVARVTIKRGSPRTPGSEEPHVELRNARKQRIDPSGNPVTRKSGGNHTPIEWDLP